MALIGNISGKESFVVQGSGGFILNQGMKRLIWKIFDWVKFGIK